MWKKLPEKVIDKIDPHAPNGCWESRNVPNPGGYTNMRMLGINEKLAHRTFYTFFKGEIPEGYVIDHLCRNRICVNPDHLEAVTRGENSRRTDPTYIHWSCTDAPKAVIPPVVGVYEVIVLPETPPKPRKPSEGTITLPPLGLNTPFNSEWTTLFKEKEK